MALLYLEQIFDDETISSEIINEQLEILVDKYKDSKERFMKDLIKNLRENTNLFTKINFSEYNSKDSIYENILFKNAREYNDELLGYEFNLSSVDKNVNKETLQKYYDEIAHDLLSYEISERINEFKNKYTSYDTQAINKLIDDLSMGKYRLEDVPKISIKENLSIIFVNEIKNLIEKYNNTEQKEMISNIIKNEFNYFDYNFTKEYYENLNMESPYEKSGFKNRYDGAEVYLPKTNKELKILCENEKINLNSINTSLIKDMSFIFTNSYREDFSGIENWDTSSVECISYMFNENAFDEDDMGKQYNKYFNQDISKWDLHNVKDAEGFLNGCSTFNQKINLDLPKCENLAGLFSGCSSLNKEIKIDAPKNKTISYIFDRNYSLDSKVELNIPECEYFNSAFNKCEVFNQPIDTKTFKKVINTNEMFSNCENFNQNLSGWELNLDVETEDMFYNCPIDDINKPIQKGFILKDSTTLKEKSIDTIDNMINEILNKYQVIEKKEDTINEIKGNIYEK